MNKMIPAEVEIKEYQDGSGDVYFEIPPVMLESLGWEEGDDVKFNVQTDGAIMVRKVKYESIELDFDEAELFKYMQIAHERDQTFNEFVQNTLTEMLKSPGTWHAERIDPEKQDPENGA